MAEVEPVVEHVQMDPAGGVVEDRARSLRCDEHLAIVAVTHRDEERGQFLGVAPVGSQVDVGVRPLESGQEGRRGGTVERYPDRAEGANGDAGRIAGRDDLGDLCLEGLSLNRDRGWIARGGLDRIVAERVAGCAGA